MKKLIFVISILSVLISVEAQNIRSTPNGTSSLPNNKVSLEEAVIAANNWFKHIKKESGAIFNIVQIDSVVKDEQCLIYMFDFDFGQFIWASADDRHSPILAYNLDPSTNPGTLPEAAEDFQDQYSNEILRTRINNIKTSFHHTGWNYALKGSFKSLITDDEVLPLMQVNWGQRSGYNQFTPENCPTGCGAVGMVQIMRHWAYPDRGKGFRSYTHGDYGYLAVNFDTVNLVWDEMPLNNPNQRIARLMYYAGIALEMDYAPDVSSAFMYVMPDILRDNFSYNGKRIESRNISAYDRMADWNNMLRNELINGRPIIMRGEGTGGHFFNFDGFRGDYFHVNWGWSGDQNGYFLTSSLNPLDKDFTVGQCCISGIFPGDTMIVDRPFKTRMMIGESKVCLGWDALPHEGFEHYKIYRDNVEIGQSVKKYYLDNTVESNQNYTYSVAAYYSIDSANYESQLTPEIVSSLPIGITLPYEVDFENGYLVWNISSSETGFNWGTAMNLGLGDDESNHFIGINSDKAGADKLVSDYLESSLVDLSETDNAILSFDYIFKQLEEEVDRLFLKYRVFEENRWRIIQELETTGSLDNWTHFECNLPEGALKENVQLAFYYTDDGEFAYGAGIDNIRIESTISGTYNIETKSEIDVYPNPTNGKVIIELFSGLNGMCSMRVYSSTGTCLINEELKMHGSELRFEKDLSNLPSGIYILRISGAMTGYTKKLIIW